MTIANPKQVKAYAESRLVRTKNDRIDAYIIAQFCAERSPHAWTPPSPEVEELQSLTRRLDALDKMLNAERNRLETAPTNLVEFKMEVVGAIMHKLIRFVFGVLHSGKPFDLEIALGASA